MYLDQPGLMELWDRIKAVFAPKSHTHKVEEIEGAAKEGHTHQASEIAGLSTVATSGNYSDLSGKPSAATESADGLMSAADKKKLDGIQAGASSYTHPTHTAHASGLYKVAVDSLGHVSSATAVTKSDITALGIPAQDTNTTYGAATANADGLMTAADKKKLDAVAETARTAASDAATAKSTADDAYSRTLRIELVSVPADAAGDTSQLTAYVYRGGELLSDQDVAQLGIVAWYVDNSRQATGWTYTCAAGTAVECRLEA